MSKHLILILSVLALGTWLAACETTDAPTDAADAGAEAGESADAAADPADEAPAEMPAAVGAELAEGTELTAIADLAADPAPFEGKTLRIQGNAVHRCGSGCSLTLADGDAKFMVKSDTEVFQFPEGWKDGDVVAEGTIKTFSGCAKHKQAAAEGEDHEHHDHHGDDAKDEVKYVLWADGAKLVKAAAAEGEAETGAETGAEAEADEKAE